MAEGSQYAKSARCACGRAGVHRVDLGLAGSIWRCAMCHALALGGGSPSGPVRPAVEPPRLDELQAAADHVLFVARKRIGLLEQQVQLLTAERVRLAAEVEAYRRRDQEAISKKYGVPNGE